MVIALRQVTLQGDEFFQCTPVFNTLCHHSVTQVVTHIDGGTDDHLIIEILTHVADKGAINLDFIGG